MIIIFIFKAVIIFLLQIVFLFLAVYICGMGFTIDIFAMRFYEPIMGALIAFINSLFFLLAKKFDVKIFFETIIATLVWAGLFYMSYNAPGGFIHLNGELLVARYFLWASALYAVFGLGFYAVKRIRNKQAMDRYHNTSVTPHETEDNDEKPK